MSNPKGYNQYATQPAGERFWEKVDKTQECWLWLGQQGWGGYGQFRVEGHRMAAHRFAYIERYGSIPEALDLDHLCRNRVCVKPDHLEAVTRKTNVLRGVGVTAAHAKKTHCLNGHPFNLLNTWVDSQGGRKCRVCKRARDSRYRSIKHA